MALFSAHSPRLFAQAIGQLVSITLATSQFSLSYLRHFIILTTQHYTLSTTAVSSNLNIFYLGSPAKYFPYGHVF